MIHDALIALSFWIERHWWQWSRHRKEIAWWIVFTVSLAAITFVIGFQVGFFWRYL